MPSPGQSLLGLANPGQSVLGLAGHSVLGLMSETREFTLAVTAVNLLQI